MYPGDALQMEMVVETTPTAAASTSSSTSSKKKGGDLPRKPCPECGKLLTNVKVVNVEDCY